jgi:hypothetical protein
MDVPDERVGYDDELSPADASRARWAVAGVAVVLLAGGILLAHASPHHAVRHTSADEPAPGPAPGEVTEHVHLGTVFLEHLPACTTTDHRHQLTVALGVTNLGARTLRLISATGLTSDPFAVRPTAQSLGRLPCGGIRASRVVQIRPAAVAVVRLHFYVTDKCPRAALVSARIGFDGGRAGVVHADSSELADLGELDFAQCA